MYLNIINYYVKLSLKESLQEIIFNNKSLKRKINELTHENDKLYDCIYNTEIVVVHRI